MGGPTTYLSTKVPFIYISIKRNLRCAVCLRSLFISYHDHVYTGKRLIQKTEIPEIFDTGNGNTGNCQCRHAPSLRKSHFELEGHLWHWAMAHGPRFLAWHVNVLQARAPLTLFYKEFHI